MRGKPTSYSEHKLSEVAFFQEGPGLRTHQWASEGMKVINVTNILSDGSVDVSNTDKYISLGEFERRYSHFAVEEDDIVVASSGNSYGKVGRVRGEHLPLMMNTSVIRFHSADRGRLDEDYLYSFLRSPSFASQVKAFVTGGAQPNFGPSHLKQMTILLPPISVQKQVAQVISAYDELIENNLRRMALLEEAARLLYREWFVRLRFPGHEHTRIVNGVPEEWEKKQLQELCDEIREPVLPDRVKPQTPYVGLEHMPRRSITLSEWGDASEVESAKHRFVEGDFLFGKIRPYFHKVGVCFTDGIASTDAIVVRSRGGAAFGLVLMTISSDLFVAHATQSSYGAKMPRANWKVLQQYPVLVPPAPLLREFTEAINRITALLKNLVYQNKKLKAARDLLLPRLMSGEVAV